MPNLLSTSAAAVAAGAVLLGLFEPAPAPAATADIGYSCPPAGGGSDNVRFEPDPANPNAYYVCVGAVPRRHVSCPPNTTLQWIGPPPTCAPQSTNS